MKDVIPDNILAAARKAGLSTPLWYAGRQKGPPRPRQKTLADLVREVEEEERAERESGSSGGVVG